MLRSIGIAEGESRRECELILRHVTNASAAELILQSNDQLSAQASRDVDEILIKRRKRLPIQYCLGSTWFMDSKFMVEPGVFIPRSDTEILVQRCSELINASDNESFQTRGNEAGSARSRRYRVVEVGIGSGAISVSLLKLHPAIEVIALEISPIACAVARRNAELNGVSDRLQIQNGDWRDFLPKEIDMFVSNPPYIPASDAITLDPEVVCHEPGEALFGSDEDGLGFYRDFAKRVPAHLRNGVGEIAVEVGDIQSGSVSQIFAASTWSNVDVKLDMSGIPRVVTARKL